MVTRTLGLSVLLALAIAAFGGASAQAVVSCSFDAPSATVTASMTANNDFAFLARSGDAITFGGVPCGAATKANTDTINITGAAGGQHLFITLSGGAFGPGKTAEASGASEIEINIDLGAGSDQLVVQGSSGGDKLTIGDAGIALNGDADADITYANVDSFGLEGVGGTDGISGQGGFGSGGPFAAAPVTINGGDGNDKLTGGEQNDGITGDADNDNLTGGNGVDFLLGGDGNDGLHGSGGSDLLEGDPGTDTLDGGDDDDTLTGGPGPDGNDVLIGGNGHDVANYQQRTAPLHLSINGVADDGDFGAGEADNITGTVENLDGGSEADTLSGNAADNFIVGEGGDDTITGGYGLDQLFGHAGHDQIDGGPDGDQLNGGDDGDTLTGGDGNDGIDGADGDDAESGGLGDDIFTQGPAPNGADVLAGGPGFDFAGYFQRTAGVQVNLDGIANDGQITPAESDNVMPDIEAAQGGSGSDRLFGSPADNQFVGNAGSDTIRGFDGRDQIIGGLGNDNIDPGDGSDFASGDEGNDRLSLVDGDQDFADGGVGTDTATFDAGIDTVVGVP